VVTTETAKQDSPGRVDKALDRFIEFTGTLNALQVVVAATSIYVLWGLILPMLLGATRVGLISFNTEGALFAGLILFARTFPILEARLRRQQFALTTNLRRLSGSEFEGLVAELFDREGWHVANRAKDGKPDGNIDLRLRRDTRERLVQCKQWSARNLGVDEVRKLGGTLMREGLSGSSGLLVTSSSFTPTARSEARTIGIELIDGDDLVARLEAVGATGLLTRPGPSAWLCPDCEKPMLLDRSPHGWWLRCPDYRNGCRGKHDLGADSRQVVERLLAQS
jgi:HJR/Mrr/RecB family endonuclease